jgi:hypothetical protein
LQVLQREEVDTFLAPYCTLMAAANEAAAAAAAAEACTPSEEGMMAVSGAAMSGNSKNTAGDAVQR